MSDYEALFIDVLSGHHNDSKWDAAIFSGIKTISNTKVGSVGQDFIERLCEKLGVAISFPVSTENKRLSQSPWDLEINGVKFELKTATEDVNGSFQFNHIRYHRKYEALMCLGVSPNKLYFNIWSKADVTTGKAGSLVSMEKSGNASYKLTKKPSQLHEIDLFGVHVDNFTRHFK